MSCPRDAEGLVAHRGQFELREHAGRVAFYCLACGDQSGVSIHAFDVPFRVRRAQARQAELIATVSGERRRRGLCGLCKRVAFTHTFDDSEICAGCWNRIVGARRTVESVDLSAWVDSRENPS